MISNTPSIFQTLLRYQTADPEGMEFGASDGVFEKFKGCLSQTPQGFPNTPSVVSKLPTRRGGSLETTEGVFGKPSGCLIGQ